MRNRRRSVVGLALDYPIPMIEFIDNFVKNVRTVFRGGEEPKQLVRGYRDVAGVGTSNQDWAVNILGEDADLWTNAWLLTTRMRDLFRTNPTFVKYRENLWSGVFGANGIMMRAKIMETEARVIHTPDSTAAGKQRALEIAYLIKWENKINKLRNHAAKMTGRSVEQYRCFKIADEMEKRDFETVIRAKATIQPGDPDLFAIKQVQDAWMDWQKARYCDIQKISSYAVNRRIRLISAVSDGDCFIRMIQHPRVNKYGFALQVISAEWVDRWFNTILPNGNEVRMGIEYGFNEFGITEPVAYYFIRRMPMDWQWSNPQGLFGNPNLYVRVPADEIIHYARPVAANSTRPAPWAASVIPKSRQLDQYELAEVIAAREQACKTGFYTSTLIPEGGQFTAPDPQGIREETMAPGETRGLPWGVEYKERNPTHPNGNFENFRKGMMRSQSAGMPGSDYNTLAADLENINFSAGRLGRLGTNDTLELLQSFDIEKAETTIFEKWLYNALVTGAIPLPLAKFDKFNKPVFQGRRWDQVDEVKAVTAAALRVANNLSSLQRECANEGVDFDEIVMERAEEKMMLEEMGLSAQMTVETPIPAQPAEDTASGEDDPAQIPKKPAKKARKSVESSTRL